MSKRLGSFWLALALCAVPSLARAKETPPAAEVAPELFPAHRFTFVGGGLLALGGVGLGLYARAEAQRAVTLSSATETTAALDRARASAASANLLYGLAGAALVYGVVLELLPQPVAEKASLTFHF